MSRRRMIHYQKRPVKPRVNMNPEISHGLLSIFLFILAGMSILSFFKLAGVAGIFIDDLLSLIFGDIRYLFPIILIISAVLIVKDVEYSYRHTHTIGAVLLFLSVNGIAHLRLPADQMIATAELGQAGGMVGLILGWPLGTYVGFWGGLLILLGLMLVSIIFLFNTTLAQLVEINKRGLYMLGTLGRIIISFFGAFKKTDAVKFSIQGDYSKTDQEETANQDTAEEDDEVRVFKQKSLQQKNKQIEEEEEDDSTEDDAQKETENQPMVLPKPIIRNLPSYDLLFTSKGKPSAGDIKGNAETIANTLANFGIEVEMGEVRVGPTVTQYSLKPSAGIKLSRITGLSNDLAMALAAHPIRIEAPIPGKSLVGVEVPNQKVAMVTLRELLESPEFQERKHNLNIALGKDVAGKVWWADLPKMPHLLVAGTTGSGKTVCINTIILSLLYQNTAETLRFIMVDPKRVELTLYNGIPHLLTPVITDPAKTINALKWTIGEMERRFDVLAKAGKREIASYNASASEPLPHIVFIIDELADLMAMAASEIEAGIIRIAQMARAVGIHLIVATQRPSVEVITGLMKANIPARIAFSVASIIDSRTILDCPGAEKLLGRGDMLLLTADMSKPKRVQGAYVSEEEIKRLVEYLKGDEAPTYDDSIVSTGSKNGTTSMFGGSSDDHDPMFEEAKKLVIESGKASASLMQRRLKVGYARAARLLDELEESGIVGPADGAKPREVFTEHFRPSDTEIPDDEQTLDAGGTVFDQPTQKSNSEDEE